jgi:hypothetical protein
VVGYCLLITRGPHNPGTLTSNGLAAEVSKVRLNRGTRVCHEQPTASVQRLRTDQFPNGRLHGRLFGLLPRLPPSGAGSQKKGCQVPLQDSGFGVQEKIERTIAAGGSAGIRQRVYLNPDP